MPTKRVSKKERGVLGEFVLNIEFLLISVVQGVTLGTLAAATSSLWNLESIEYWPYILTGFLVILLFWSQAIVHTISFIDWPLNLWHTFFYFALGFIEVVAFTQVENPVVWFAAMGMFSFVGFFLFKLDLRLIRDRRNLFTKNKVATDFYDAMIKEQRLTMLTVVPATALFGFGVALLIHFNMELFIEQKWHVAFGLAQLFFTILSVFRAIHVFNTGVPSISQIYGSEADFVD